MPFDRLKLNPVACSLKILTLWPSGMCSVNPPLLCIHISTHLQTQSAWSLLGKQKWVMCKHLMLSVYVVGVLAAFHFPTANYAFYNNYHQRPSLNGPKRFKNWQSTERTLIFNFHLYGIKEKCVTFLLPPHSCSLYVDSTKKVCSKC